MPFNPDSFTVMQIFPFFADKQAEMTRRYIELSFEDIIDNHGLRNDFLTTWQKSVGNHFQDLE